jgi:hypothetical protein
VPEWTSANNDVCSSSLTIMRRMSAVVQTP